MTRDVDLVTLRLLVAIGQTGSLNRGASATGITQPAASARVRAFETRWRIAVLQRSPRGSRLTTDGEAVVSWAAKVLHSVDQMRTSLEAMSATRTTSLRVAASLTVAEHVLPRWVGELATGNPDVKPTLKVVNSEHVVDHVRTGRADLGFIETERMPTGLAHRTVGEDRLAIVVSRDHPWARRRTALSDAQLSRARWVLREQGSGTRDTFERALTHEPTVALDASSTAALIGAAVAGVGPAVLSARSVATDLATGRLVEVDTDVRLVRPLTAVWRTHERLSDAAAELLRIAVADTGG